MKISAWAQATTESRDGGHYFRAVLQLRYLGRGDYVDDGHWPSRSVRLPRGYTLAASASRDRSATYACVAVVVYRFRKT